MIGYLKRLLPKRRDLKLIITSATIDAVRFAQHFPDPAGRPAPILEVSGRAFPVDVRYRPVQPEDDGGDPDLERAVLDAVDELAGEGPGDILVFMPTERDILETAKALRGRTLGGDRPGRTSEILPFYARLPNHEQQRIFQAHTQRRIVIATNVAESSLTVPGIRYVVDPGTARISRYSARSKTQRLPIEPISRASADQRKGRCGRVGPGVCIRLYGEDDYLARDRYTAPEIQRTNLAAVILQTTAFRLGDIERFPFLDPPRADAVRDGYKTLFELGALDENRELTEIGRKLSRLPVDPRIGRMILAAEQEGCLSEVLVIAAALELQDPRERPVERQEAADERHARFADPESDFLSYLKLWDFYHKLKGDLSRNQLRKACRDNFLSHNRMREWTDIHLQLMDLVREAGIQSKGEKIERRPPQPSEEDSSGVSIPLQQLEGDSAAVRSRQKKADVSARYERIHRAILTGLLSNLALRGESHEYTVAGGGKAYLWPGSGVFASGPKWIMAAEVIETTRRYLRTCARINPRWIEPLSGHLLKRAHSDVRWDRQAAAAVAQERVSLFGLTIVPRRQVRYGPIDPAAARQLLIQDGLVEEQFDLKADFFAHNHMLRLEVERLEEKLRRRDLLRGQWAIYDFYDRRIPEDVYDGQRLLRWLRGAESSSPGRRPLFMARADLLNDDAPVVAENAFPDTLPVERAELPLEYQFEPGSEQDGLTVHVPLEALNQLDADRLDWLVPGLLEQTVVAMIRALPKSLRSALVPPPQSAHKALGLFHFGAGTVNEAVAAALSRIAGERIAPHAFDLDKLPTELRMKIRVLGEEGQTLAQGPDLGQIRRQLGQQAAAGIATLDDPRWNRDGLTTWDLDELPEQIEIHRRGMTFKAFPLLVDQGDSVAVRLADSPQRAAAETRAGLRRLFTLGAWRDLKTQVDWLPGLDKMRVYAASVPGFDVRQQLAGLIADRAFVAGRPIPRSKDEFDRQLKSGREQIGLAVQEAAGLMLMLLEALHQARLAVERASPKWQYAIDDVREQMDQLTGPAFLTATPWEWLQHYPRYLRAIRQRLESLPGGSLARDQRAYHEQLQPRWQACLDRLCQERESGDCDPELVQYRWMLEEFRVSLFAQKLGTSLPVSAKRLEQQWAKVRRG